MIRCERQRYLQRRAVAGPWRVEGETGDGWSLAVVIPACAEADWLFKTLDSLAANPEAERRRCLVLVVINQTTAAAPEVAESNRRTLERLRGVGGHPGLKLAWVDAASSGLELSGSGPGPARRLGLDRALMQLAVNETAALVCLDADTLVDADYLPALFRHFAAVPAGGAVLDFVHQPAATPALQQAMDHYELYLRCHQFGMQFAGSPYAFATIGSAMACTARAYVRIGGMNRKPAAEDFYFLQALAKTDGVALVQGTRVHPAARLSSRVIFGTGPAVQRLVDNPGAFPVAPLAAYALLGELLKRIDTATDSDGAALCEAADTLHPLVGGFMQGQQLATVWDALRANHRSAPGLNKAFHSWFDALKTLQLLKNLAKDQRLAPQPVEQVAAQMLAASGIVAADACSGCLQQMQEFLYKSAKTLSKPRAFG